MLDHSIVVSPDAECPCGQGKLGRRCCNRGDGHLFCQERKLRKLELNAIANPRCYLRFTNRCSRNGSKEHIISESVLEVLGNRLVADFAMPWRPARPASPNGEP